MDRVTSPRLLFQTVILRHLCPHRLVEPLLPTPCRNPTLFRHPTHGQSHVPSTPIPNSDPTAPLPTQTGGVPSANPVPQPNSVPPPNPAFPSLQAFLWTRIYINNTMNNLTKLKKANRFLCYGNYQQVPGPEAGMGQNVYSVLHSHINARGVACTQLFTNPAGTRCLQRTRNPENARALVCTQPHTANPRQPSWDMSTAYYTAISTHEEWRKVNSTLPTLAYVGHLEGARQPGWWC
jgi:hypothetical protein